MAIHAHIISRLRYYSYYHEGPIYIEYGPSRDLRRTHLLYWIYTLRMIFVRLGSRVVCHFPLITIRCRRSHILLPVRAKAIELVKNKHYLNQSRYGRYSRNRSADRSSLSFFSFAVVVPACSSQLYLYPVCWPVNVKYSGVCGFAGKRSAF